MTDKPKEGRPDHLLDTIEENKAQLLAQIKASMDLMREEYINASGTAKDNAKAAIESMREFRMDLVRMHRSAALSPEQARRLISAANRSQQAIVDLQENNKGAPEGSYADGKSITERVREKQKELATRESIIAVLNEINERREAANNEAKRKHENLKNTFRQGLSAFLGPAGPLVETFVQLKDEYGDDAKELTTRFKRWIRGEKDILDEFEKETARQARRDNKLFDMFTNKFRRFGNMLSGMGRGIIDSLMDFMGWGGGKGGKPGGGKPGGAGGKAGKWWGRLGKLGRLGGRLLPGIGMLLGGAGMVSDIDGGSKNEGALDTGVSYLGGAMTGATAGGLVGGPIGALIGGVVGLLVTGVMRNWSSFKRSVVGGWNAVVETGKTAWGKMTEFGTDFIKFSTDAYTSVTDGFKKMLTWLRDNIPGFNVAMKAVEVAKVTAKTAAKSIVQAGGEVATTTVTAAQAAGTKVAATAQSVAKAGGAAATSAKIAVAGAVEKGAQKVADATPTSTVGRNAQSVANFAGAVGGKAMLERQMTAAGITDPKERAMMLAQVDHESGFRARSEDMTYRSVAQMDKTFGKNAAYSKLSADQKAALVNNPEALANVVYGKRMGNTDAGDGYKYRGRGMIQLTGKDNYAKYGKMLGIDLVGNPDLANDPEIAARLATAYWQTNKLGAAAQAGDVAAVTKGINGGYNGLDDRQAKYAQYVRATQQIDPGVTASVAPQALDYERAASVAPTTAVSLADNSGAKANAVNSRMSVTDSRPVRAPDIPLVLGENHMVVLNSAMLGA